MSLTHFFPLGGMLSIRRRKFSFKRCLVLIGVLYLLIAFGPAFVLILLNMTLPESAAIALNTRMLDLDPGWFLAVPERYFCWQSSPQGKLAVLRWARRADVQRARSVLYRLMRYSLSDHGEKEFLGRKAEFERILDDIMDREDPDLRVIAATLYYRLGFTKRRSEAFQVIADRLKTARMADPEQRWVPPDEIIIALVVKDPNPLPPDDPAIHLIRNVAEDETHPASGTAKWVLKAFEEQMNGKSNPMGDAEQRSD